MPQVRHVSPNAGKSGSKTDLRQRRRCLLQAGSIYTCPMDPEVRQSEPGSCPKCGMALEPAEPAGPLDPHRVDLPHAPGSGAGSNRVICPKCGMALEPRTVYAAEEENPELVDMRRRFWVSLVLTVPSACHRHGRHDSGRSIVSGKPGPTPTLGLGGAGPGYPGGPVGRLALLCPGRAVQ